MMIFNRKRNAVIFLIMAICIFSFSMLALSADLPLCKDCGDRENCDDGNGFNPPSGYGDCNYDEWELPPCEVVLGTWMECS